MLVVSPHLDDAVLSAFALLDHQTNTSVLTVFTGAPADLTTDWDRDRGFPDATAQMSARLLEEHAVMDFVGISHEELDFIPVQYCDPVLAVGLCASIVRSSLLRSMI